MLNLKIIKRPLRFLVSLSRNLYNLTRQKFCSFLLIYADRIGYSKWRRNPLGHIRGHKSDYDVNIP